MTPIGPLTPCVPTGAPTTGSPSPSANYIGDVRQPPPGAPFCISSSKVSFPQWGISDPLIATLGDSPLKGNIHLALDQAVIDPLNAALGLPAGMPPHCKNWQQMP
jgi:hypothetical protein